MAPMLYYLEFSPPVRAVLLTAKAIGLQLELKTVNLMEKEHLTPEFTKINPQHTVPTLDDDGFIVWDSHAICAYLVGKYAKNDSLYPKELQKRAVVDQRLYFDCGTLFPGLRAVFFPVFNTGCKTISEEKHEALHQGYSFSNAFLKGNEYFAGDQLTIADFCAIATLSSIVPVVPFDTAKLPHLARWMAKMKTLPYYQEVNGKGADGVSARVNEMLGK